MILLIIKQSKKNIYLAKKEKRKYKKDNKSIIKTF